MRLLAECWLRGVVAGDADERVGRQMKWQADKMTLKHSEKNRIRQRQKETRDIQLLNKLAMSG